jgi:hypothetical protein
MPAFYEGLFKCLKAHAPENRPGGRKHQLHEAVVRLGEREGGIKKSNTVFGRTPQ